MNLFASRSPLQSVALRKPSPGDDSCGRRALFVGIVAILVSACASAPEGARWVRHIEQGDLAMMELRSSQQTQVTEAAMLTTPTGVLFETGQAELAPGAQAWLRQLSMTLERNPDRQIVLVGHADSVGGDLYNQELSQRRAGAVRQYLLEQGIDPQRIDMVARGESKPVTSNRSELGRQQNRRVEIAIRN